MYRELNRDTPFKAIAYFPRVLQAFVTIVGEDVNLDLISDIATLSCEFFTDLMIVVFRIRDCQSE